nr:protein rae1 [Quercus suber]
MCLQLDDDISVRLEADVFVQLDARALTCFYDRAEMLRYWDTRQSNPMSTQQLPDLCYSFIVRHPLMVVCTTDHTLIVFNLLNPQGKRGIEKQPFQLPEAVVSSWGL